MPLDGGTPVDLAAPLDRNVMPGGPAYPGAPPVFAGDNRMVLFCIRDRGCTHLYSIPVDGGTPAPIVTGAARYVSGLSVVGNTAVTVLGTDTSFGEVAAVDLLTGKETVLTGHGATLGEVELYPREEREFTVSDGTHVHGWIMRDASFAEPRPLLLDVHGGPHNAWNGAADEMHLYHQELVARGWAVLLINPRGSDGYGHEFFTAALGAWGESDAKDFLEPIDELVAEGLADPERLAVTGYSYGGYMTCYLTSRDDRFAAAVAGGVVCDLASQVGSADPGTPWRYELEAQPWEDRELYEGCRRTGRSTASGRRRSCTTAPPTCAVPSVRRSSGSRLSAYAECPRNSFSTLTHPIYSSWRDSCRIGWTSTAASLGGSSSTPTP